MFRRHTLRSLTLRERLLSYLAVSLMLFMATSSGGCGMSSAERIAATQRTLESYEAKSASADEAIKDLEQLITEAKAALAVADGDKALDILKLIADAESKLQTIKDSKPKLDESVSTWRTRLTEIQANPNLTWADEATAAGAGLQASAPLFGPYGWIVSALGLLVGAAGTIFGTRERAKARSTSPGLNLTSP